MARTDQERYNEAVAHIKKLDGALGADVQSKIGPKQLNAGQEISLAGAGYWHTGTPEQHTAVRAYLLCLLAYFRTPYSKIDWCSNVAMDTARTRLKNKSPQQVNQEILLFLKKPSATYADLMAAALRVKYDTGSVDPIARTREDTNVGANPICYNGVATWLFASGFVSKRWLANKGMDLKGSTASLYLGDGDEVPEDRWGSIPAGWIWNVHKAGDNTTNHWGISLGGGRAVACNNTDESHGVKLIYEPGGRSQYGIFDLINACDVMRRNAKYLPPDTAYNPAVANIVVRELNPLTAGFF